MVKLLRCLAPALAAAQFDADVLRTLEAETATEYYMEYYSEYAMDMESEYYADYYAEFSEPKIPESTPIPTPPPTAAKAAYIAERTMTSSFDVGDLTGQGLKVFQGGICKASAEALAGDIMQDGVKVGSKKQSGCTWGSAAAGRNLASMEVTLKQEITLFEGASADTMKAEEAAFKTEGNALEAVKGVATLFAEKADEFLMAAAAEENVDYETLKTELVAQVQAFADTIETMAVATKVEEKPLPKEGAKQEEKKEPMPAKEKPEEKVEEEEEEKVNYVHDDDADTAAIVGAIIGSIAGVGLVAGGGYYYYKKKQAENAPDGEAYKADSV